MINKMPLTCNIAISCFLFWLAADATQDKIKKQPPHIAFRHAV